MRVAALSSLLLLMWLAGCATKDDAGTSTTPPRSSSTPRYNLAGYSPAFKAGYTDACATPRRRSEARFKSDEDYRMGWQDGSSVCSKTPR